MNYRNEIDFPALAQRIIDKVARQLMPHRPIFSETDSELRIGNRGSFRVSKEIGCYQDFDPEPNTNGPDSGGLLDMIMHLTDCRTREQSLKWLEDNGYRDNTLPAVNDRQRPAPSRTHRKAKHTEKDMFPVGLKRWNESEPVTMDPNHPVRLWCAHRNLWQPDRPLPKILKWHPKQSKIIVTLSEFDDYKNAYPNTPEPQQFHLISITATGEKRGKKGDDKRKYGSAKGKQMIALLGDPNAPNFQIAEGIADALALYSRITDSCVITPTTNFLTLCNCDSLLSHLAADGRSVTLCSDNDPTGHKAQNKLAIALHHRGCRDVFFRPAKAKDPAEEAFNEGWQ